MPPLEEGMASKKPQYLLPSITYHSWWHRARAMVWGGTVLCKEPRRAACCCL